MQFSPDIKGHASQNVKSKQRIPHISLVCQDNVIKGNLQKYITHSEESKMKCTHTHTHI